MRGGTDFCGNGNCGGFSHVWLTVLTTAGTVYMAGDGSSGQLGNGQGGNLGNYTVSGSRQPTLQIPTGMAGVTIAKIMAAGEPSIYNGNTGEGCYYNNGTAYEEPCGGGITGLIDTAGNLYVTGSGNSYATGLGSNTDVNTFQLVNDTGFQGKVVKYIVPSNMTYSTTGTRYHFAYILDSNGDVWSAGMEANGQLGNNSDGNRTTFQKVYRNTDGAKVVDIRVAVRSDSVATGSVILLLEDGSLMTTGYNGSRSRWKLCKLT
jgi:alpha-tubulin suppressor-like RCC1 family protein